MLLDLFTALQAVKDRSATTLVGPNATIQQLLNASLVTALYHCWLQLSKLPDGYSEGVTKILEPAIMVSVCGCTALLTILTMAVLGTSRKLLAHR